jgi:alpha-N-acetylglucosaminidase
MKPALLAILLAVPCALAGPEDAGRGVIERRLPAQAGRFAVEPIPAEGGRDVFEVESRDGKIVLRGNDGVAIASALNRYLKSFCHANISWNCGDQLNLPPALPPVTQKVRVASPHRFRFVYNYCTHGYTMAWWDWPRWEREIDFLALQGVNLALVIQGQEQVWINTLKEFGYTDAEVRQWLVMPSHQPWMYMSNMENYGGPVPQSLIDKRVDLGRRIVARMRALGMEPVLQGYYGIVPSDFARRFPDARVHAQGRWSILKRPDMLEPTDPLFARLAAVFYREQAKLFGKANFFAADPFHEGGSTAGIDIPACGQAIFGAMQQAVPGSTWVLQSWQANPRQPMIDVLPKDRLLVLDLFCEREENWRARKNFGDTPWLWCTVHNFGGNSGLCGRLAWLGEGPAKALRDPAQHTLRGIGALMEGSETLPVIWEMFFENAWRDAAPDLAPWLRDYARRRYGASIPAADQAWTILASTAYSTPGGHGEFPVNSAVCARPSLNPDQRARQYTGTQPFYNTAQLVEAWRLLLDAAPEAGPSDAYRYDLADLGRQVLADLGTRYHKRIVALHRAGDKAALRGAGDRMLGLIGDMDELAGSRPELLLGTWLADARSWGTTPEEKDLAEWNARTLLTTWTVPESHIDYANRHWNGLLGGFYRHRWELWLAALNGDTPLDEGAVRKSIRDWEYAWTRQHDAFPIEPRGDTIAIARRLYERYQSDARSPLLELGPVLSDAKAGDFVGRWRYPAEGATFVREIGADGSTRLYRNGQPLDWDGFTWKFEDGLVDMRKADGTVFGRHALRDRDTLLFLGEPWGPATRDRE